MLIERRFNIVAVGKNKGVGTNSVDNFDKMIKYKGKKVIVKL